MKETQQPEQEMGTCDRCQIEVPEESLTNGLCENCYSDMYEEWQLATQKR